MAAGRHTTETWQSTLAAGLKIRMPSGSGDNGPYWQEGPFLIGHCIQCNAIVYDARYTNTRYVQRFADDDSICGSFSSQNKPLCDNCF